MFASNKVRGGVARYESQLERDFYLLLEHDPHVITFQPQPVEIPYLDGAFKERYIPVIIPEYTSIEAVR